MIPIQPIKIAHKTISADHPCFIIAEAGVNHNGDITLAKRLIDAAVDAGADAVKFQTFRADDVVTSTAEKAAYQKETTGSEESQYEMIKQLELTYQEFHELYDYAGSKGIIFLSTPFDEESVDFLDRLGLPAFKIPSGEITNVLLLKKIAEKKKPIILSTGMATLGEVEEAVNYLRQHGAQEIMLLHCTTSYPAPIHSVNLRAMETMRCSFKLPVGYSDHTEGITIPIAAAAMGAKVIEKHFTLYHSLPGPDHQASLEPGELKAMVQAIRDVERAFGDGVKSPYEEEMAIKKVARRSIVAKRDLAVGALIQSEDLGIKRPGTGIEPKFLDQIIGKKAKKAIPRDHVIIWDMVE
ncbi:N-acetylneuraminate synthase [Methanocalculus sp.]|uniref:N-acetylneuraminate synthase n=1 Tax=Methanocalculus sp. TaxID=2004547 RepID=UPI0026384BE8|nr:N-acetylneuraminate synthase [Methanocalculus sp.]MDG6250933.1 N-acetylneuraminate synthase [Methanocalculus sp.]